MDYWVEENNYYIFYISAYLTLWLIHAILQLSLPDGRRVAVVAIVRKVRAFKEHSAGEIPVEATLRKVQQKTTTNPSGWKR